MKDSIIGWLRCRSRVLGEGVGPANPVSYMALIKESIIEAVLYLLKILL